MIVLAAQLRGDWRRLKACAHDACRGVFYDTSRSGSGKWCSMRRCGAQLKSPYQQIIGMGRSALSPLLEQLKEQPDHWFWALKSITGEDPVPEESRGDLQAMTQAWLAWGRQRRLC